MAPKSALSVSKWPTSSLDCISWSADSEISVACVEGLEIFIPKLDIGYPSTDSDVDESQLWHKVKLQVNLFTHQDLPLLEPAHSDIYSIGEEQSTGSIVAASWSPPGLAKHKRCALAVLTSNLVLSIWANEGNRATSNDWTRPLIVNSWLLDLDKSFPNSPSASSTTDQDRIRSRVRAFSWSPPLPHEYSHFSKFDSSSLIRYNPSYIAISNDANEIIICQLQSPFTNSFNNSSSWTAKPVLRFDLTSLPVPSTGSIHNIPFFTKNSATYLSWSPWIGQKSGEICYRSCLAFIANSDVYLIECALEIQNSRMILKFGAEVLALDHQKPSMIRWAFHPIKKDTLLLSTAGLHLISTEIQFAGKEEGLKITKVSLSESVFSWNRPAGLAYGVAKEQSSLFIAKEHSKRGTKSLYFDVPLDEIQNLDASEWSHLDQSLEDIFVQTMKTFPFGATFKFWGLSSNINGDQVAICASAHPKDVIEYSTLSEREYLLFFEKALDAGPTHILTSSAESICLSITRLIDSDKGHSDNSGVNVVLEWISAASIPKTVLNDLTVPMSSIDTPEDAVTYLSHIFRPYKLVLPRIYNYFSKTRNSSDPTIARKPPLEIRFLLALISAIFRVPEDCLYRTTLTNLILHKYQQAQIFILRTWQSYFENKNDSKLSESYGNGNGYMESCEICASDIPFEDTSWAQCVEGHQYTRCALTLLAIQIPGCSRLCNLCGTRYLSDEYLLGTEKESQRYIAIESDTTLSTGNSNPEVSHPPKLSLVEILLAGCETCILCGGKFAVL